MASFHAFISITVFILIMSNAAIESDKCSGMPFTREWKTVEGADNKTTIS